MVNPREMLKDDSADTQPPRFQLADANKLWLQPRLSQRNPFRRSTQATLRAQLPLPNLSQNSRVYKLRRVMLFVNAASELWKVSRLKMLPRNTQNSTQRYCNVISIMYSRAERVIGSGSTWPGRN